MSFLHTVDSFIRDFWNQEEEQVGHQSHQVDESFPVDGSVVADRSYFGGDGSIVADRSYFGDRSVIDADRSYCNAGSMIGADGSYFNDSVCAPSAPAYMAQPQQAAPWFQSDPKMCPSAYKARQDDPVDVQVAEFFRQHPNLFLRNSTITRIRPGWYLLEGRTINLEMIVQHGGLVQLLVKDGPLKQPLANYLDKDDRSAEYSGSVFRKTNALQTIPQDCRMTFCDAGAGYDRVQAMKVAKEQAKVREEAATMLRKGQPSFGALQAKYDKTISARLGAIPEKAPSAPQFSNKVQPMVVSGTPRMMNAMCSQRVILRGS